MPDTAQININDEREVRIKKLQDLRDAGINPYPAKSTRTHTVGESLAQPHETSVTITGRIITKREMGKLIFCHMRDESGDVQIVLKQGDIEKELFKLFEKKIDIGDIIQITGDRFQTQKGEESILVTSFTLLSKTLRPLPDKFHGLHDEEARYRKRYLDFLTNKEQRSKIEIRANLTRYIREFLHEKGFLEIETPMLETIASGAMAKTFDTHLNAFDLPVHLRICIGELWQKRLLVGGFEKTFEIGRAFRNEGVDHQHNPEFTMLEYYWAYADYEDNMNMHEEMLPFVIQKSIGTLVVEYEGNTIDFTPSYKRITFRDAVLEHSGIDINEHDSLEELKQVMDKKGLETEGEVDHGKLLDSLYKQTTRPKIIQPTFVLNYPASLKPLAKKAEDPRYTEMFQLVVSGFELSNSYTELNDPIDQRERFEGQAHAKAEGDEEAMAYDYDYVEALEHGMPPATGTGIGIDRFTALITGSHTIREVTAFPLMKPEQEKTNTVVKTVSQGETFEKLPVDRDGAMKLLDKHHEPGADYTHYLESEAVMRGLAEHLGRDIEYWGLLGLLHDLDWGYTKQDEEKHCTMTPKILREEGFPEDFVENVLSHAYGSPCGGLDDKVRTREIEFAIACGETVTGLVHAAARLRPEKIATLKVSSLKKKFKNKKFAEKVNRNVILECEELGVSLDVFLQISIDSITKIADQVDLV